MGMDLHSRIKRPTGVSERLVMLPGQNGAGKIYDVCDHAKDGRAHDNPDVKGTENIAEGLRPPLSIRNVRYQCGKRRR